ncbi:MAG: hypothetical protein EP329_06610 [Deltaproteobacteria bacterium]|nr:MAG: hypothetical protein EP329_06610 [Deltaproteobacteria bacterium]
MPPTHATVQRRERSHSDAEHAAPVVQMEGGGGGNMEGGDVARAAAHATKPDTAKKTDELSDELAAAGSTAPMAALVARWRQAGVNDDKILRAVGKQDWDALVRNLFQDDAAWVEAKVLGLTSSSHKDACKFGMYAIKARYNLQEISGQWGGRALARLWEALARVPASHVSRATNQQLKKLVGEKSVAPGASWYGGGEIRMDYQNTDRFLDTMKVGDVQGDSKVASYGRAAKRGLLGLAGKRNTRVNRQNLFSHTVLHEVGHAVDEQLKVMNGHMGDPLFGSWQAVSKSWNNFSYAIRDDHVTAGGNRAEAEYVRDIGKKVAAGEASLGAAKKATDKGPGGKKLDTAGVKGHPIFVALEESKKGKIPWNNRPTAVNGRIYHQAYDTEFVSYDATLRSGLEISKYQWRAPGEFFAEIYAAYYTGALAESHPLYGWFEAEIHGRANMDPLRLKNPTQWQQEQEGGGAAADASGVAAPT